jgi:hypothetical protein
MNRTVFGACEKAWRSATDGSNVSPAAAAVSWINRRRETWCETWSESLRER